MYAEQYLDSATSPSVIQQEAKIVYEKWDALLNEVYQYLKTVLSEDEFLALQEDEIEWIVAKEAAMDEASDTQYYLIGIEFTKERCDYLISLID